MQRRLLSLGVFAVLAWIGTSAGLVVSCGGEDFTSAASRGNGGGDAGGPSSSQSAGGTSSSSGPGSGGGDACEGPEDVCSSCMLESCAPVACACWANPDCVGLFDCFTTN